MQPTVFRFVKQAVRWYIDLPAYLEQGGFQDDLEMIMGADTMLELYANGEPAVDLMISETPFEGADVLQRIAAGQEGWGGADYMMTYFEGRTVDQPVWLCDVTLFVFGVFPEVIYIRRA
jgi:hypothetical protein